MAVNVKKVRKGVEAQKTWGYDNMDSPLSYDPINSEKIDYEEWTKFLSYYRYYVDEFAVDILGMTNLFPFQRLLLRAMGRFPNIMFIMCRGLTKSYIAAIFIVCMAILYPGMAIGIVSGNGNQARMVIKQKIEGELCKNENIKREISNINTGQDNCIVQFKNGSSIRAFTLGNNQKGDSSRGKFIASPYRNIRINKMRENCWKSVKICMLQHNDEISISVNAKKYILYANQQPSCE